MASSAKNMPSLKFICRNEECRKVFTKFCILKVDITLSKQKKVLNHTVYVSPGETFETFVDLMKI